MEKEKSNINHNKVFERHSKYSDKLPIMQGEVEEIINRIHEKTRTDKKVIREVICSQFRFIESVSKQCDPIDSEEFDPETYKSVRLSKLGRFEVVNTFRRKYKEDV